MTRAASALGVSAAAMSVVLSAACTSTDSGGDSGSTSTAPPSSSAPTRPVVDENDLSDREVALLRQVRADGRVEILVEHSLEATPKPTAEYRQAVADAQQNLLDELEEYEVDVGRRFDHRPLFSVTVDEAALLYLIEAPRVVRLTAVTDDEPG